MKTVVIYFHQLPTDEAYVESYVDFAALCAQHDITVLCTSGNSYQGNHTFTNTIRLHKDHQEPIEGAIHADLIFMKAGRLAGAEETPSNHIINNPKLAAIAQDKWLTYEHFPALLPATYTIDSHNWQDVLEKITTDLVVIKPRTAYGGKDVFIQNKKTLDFKSLGIGDGYIAQNFLTTVAGIPGITPGKHDLRIFIANGKVVLSFLRIPQGDNLIANLAFGSTLETVDITKIPADALVIVSEVEKEFSLYGPRFYCIDFMFENGKAYIGEINSQPAVPLLGVHGEVFFKTYHKVLLEVFQSAL